MRTSTAVLDVFSRDLPDFTGLSTIPILLTMDGYRFPDAAPRRASSYFDQLRQAFRARVAARGHDIIDAGSLFSAHFRAQRVRFEDSRDLHWNGTAHGVVADAVARSMMFTGLSF